MAKTLIGVFDDKASAENAMRALETEGVPANHIHLMDNSETTASNEGDGVPWTEKVARWFDSLFEDDADKVHADTYKEAWRRGHYIVSADVESSLVDRAIAVMNSYGTVDVEQRAAEWRSTGYTGKYDRRAKPYTADQRAYELATYQTQPKMVSKASSGHRATTGDQAMTGAQAIPVVQEELRVGKRVVQRGGVRVHSYLQERPVEEVVRLREERVNVQRVPVDRPATAADMAFKNQTVDVTAMAEEPVVEKRARVVEEVRIGKEVDQRQETIKETVRRKDVKVENIPIPADTASTKTTTTTTGPASARTRSTNQPESRR